MEKNLICKDCGTNFILKEGEAKRYLQKGYTEPKRCKVCREKENKKRKSIYYGLEEAFYNYVPVRIRKKECIIHHILSADCDRRIRLWKKVLCVWIAGKNLYCLHKSVIFTNPKAKKFQLTVSFAENIVGKRNALINYKQKNSKENKK